MSNPVWALPAILVALVVHLVLHEAGHVVAARLVGFRLKWVRVVPLVGLGVEVDDGRPPGETGGRLQWAVVHVAAPLANVAASAIVAAVGGVGLWESLRDTVLFYTAALPEALVGMGLLIALVHLLPAPTTDGGKVILALKTGHVGPGVQSVTRWLWAASVVDVLAVAMAIRAVLRG
jgi:stage IV sporulation protein FB